MASYLQNMIFITLILATAIPISTCHRRRWRRSDDSSSNDIEHELKDICSKTDRSDECWKILKSELHRFNDSDDGDIIDGVIDLAIEKSKEIRLKLNKWSSDSNNDELKEKYHSCSKNYNEITHNLEEARKNINSDDHRKVSNLIKNGGDNLEKCKRKFKPNSFDPAHVGDRNNELGLYLDIARAAEGHLEDWN